MKALVLYLALCLLLTGMAYAQAPTPGGPVPAPLDPKLAFSNACLQAHPPDQDDGFSCELNGYATTVDVDAFERTRGYERVVHEDGSADTWRRIGWVHRAGHRVKQVLIYTAAAVAIIAFCSSGACN